MIKTYEYNQHIDVSRSNNSKVVTNLEDGEITHHFF